MIHDLLINEEADLAFRQIRFFVLLWHSHRPAMTDILVLVERLHVGHLGFMLFFGKVSHRSLNLSS